MTKTLTDKEYNSVMENADKPVTLFFTADW